MSKIGALIATAALLVPLGLLGQPGASATPPAPPDEPGPWAVGLTSTSMVDASRDGRSLPVDIWYPVDRDDVAGVGQAQLDLVFTRLGLPGVLSDPEPSREGPFPLVVFSHGSGGVRFQSWFLMQALASHGFVVAAPDHVGNTAIDGLTGTTDPFDVVARNRPRDVSFVIDEMIAQNADRTDPVAPVVDPDRIAVVGHSFGGFTALASAGGFGDYEADARVDAIVPLAAAGLMTDEELATIDVPTMVINGTADATVPLAGSGERVWSLLGARQSYRVDIVDGGHNSFTNACDLAEAFEGTPGIPPGLLPLLTSSAAEACGPELIPIDDAHEIITSYTVAFLNKAIGERGGYTRYLTPSYPQRAGFDVEYRRSIGTASVSVG
jgi:predicted dienelactone hydrolase